MYCSVLHRAAVRLAVVVLALVATGGAFAIDMNGFLREKGRGDVAVSFTTESYDEFWVGDMKVSDPGVGEVDTQSLSVWGAYGLTDRVTLIANLPYVDTEGDGLGGFSEDGLSDISLLGACRLFGSADHNRHTVVGAFGLRTIASNYVADAPVSVGDGTADWLLRAIYQFRHANFYVSQQVGFDLRGGDAPNGMPLYTEIGNTWGRTTLNAFYSRLLADDGTDIGDPGFTFPSNEEEYSRGGLKAYFRVNDGFGLAVSAFTTFDGRNTGDSTGFSLGANFGY